MSFFHILFRLIGPLMLSNFWMAFLFTDDTTWYFFCIFILLFYRTRVCI